MRAGRGGAAKLLCTCRIRPQIGSRFSEEPSATFGRHGLPCMHVARKRDLKLAVGVLWLPGSLWRTLNDVKVIHWAISKPFDPADILLLADANRSDVDSAFGSSPQQSKARMAAVRSTQRSSSGASSSSRLSVQPESDAAVQASMDRESSGESMVSAISTVDSKPDVALQAARESAARAAAAAAAAAVLVAKEPLFGHPRYRKLRNINR